MTSRAHDVPSSSDDDRLRLFGISFTLPVFSNDTGKWFLVGYHWPIKLSDLLKSLVILHKMPQKACTHLSSQYPNGISLLLEGIVTTAWWVEFSDTRISGLFSIMLFVFYLQKILWNRLVENGEISLPIPVPIAYIWGG